MYVTRGLLVRGDYIARNFGTKRTDLQRMSDN